jgi:hypothetical protein
MAREPLTLNDRYRLGAPLSSGATSTVYRGIDERTGADVALKRAHSAVDRNRFDAEARLLAALNHPQVVRIVDHFSDASGQYLVMELIKGTELGVLLRRRGEPGLPLGEVVEYVSQVCAALQYVHDQQIVHRDVKPANLILGERGVMLVDFGIARMLDSSAAEVGTLGVGTPGFMAPEVFASGMVSPRTDVYGIAATFWTLVAGTPPVYGDPRRLSELSAGVPAKLAEAVRAGLDLEPSRRIASAAGFAQALGAPIAPETGGSLAISIDRSGSSGGVLESAVRFAAGVFRAAGASICLLDPATGELVYRCAWGAGAREIVGMRLRAGDGIAGSVVASGIGEAVPECRCDPRFAVGVAADTGYVPHTVLVVPLRRGSSSIGALSILDRRDGQCYLGDDVEPATRLADLTVRALELTHEDQP